MDRDTNKAALARLRGCSHGFSKIFRVIGNSVYECCGTCHVKTRHWRVHCWMRCNRMATTVVYFHDRIQQYVPYCIWCRTKVKRVQPRPDHDMNHQALTRLKGDCTHPVRVVKVVDDLVTSWCKTCGESMVILHELGY